jgi:hypothetical protein
MEHYVQKKKIISKIIGPAGQSPNSRPTLRESTCTNAQHKLVYKANMQQQQGAYKPTLKTECTQRNQGEATRNPTAHTPCTMHQRKSVLKPSAKPHGGGAHGGKVKCSTHSQVLYAPSIKHPKPNNQASSQGRNPRGQKSALHAKRIAAGPYLRISSAQITWRRAREAVLHNASNNTS